MERLVEGELEELVKKHAPDSSLSALDDIVLGYVVEVLLDIGKGDSSFDVDQFVDMISAYIPEFASVDRGHVCGWAFELASHIKDQAEGSSSEAPPAAIYNSSGDSDEVATVTTDKQSLSDNSVPQETEREEPLQNEHPTAPVPPECNSEHLDLLKEMFPAVLEGDIVRTLNGCDGNVDECIEKLLKHTQMAGERLKVGVESSSNGASRSERVTDIKEDMQLKELVLSKYAYVDTKADSTTHKPRPPKQDDKKLVRYRDGHVVSTKGERFSVLAKKDEEGEDMKKTYTSIKPLRKYRFH